MIHAGAFSWSWRQCGSSRPTIATRIRPTEAIKEAALQCGKAGHPSVGTRPAPRIGRETHAAPLFNRSAV